MILMIVIGGLLGSLSALLPVLLILGSRKLRRQPAFQLVANLALQQHVSLLVTFFISFLNMAQTALPLALCSVLQAFRFSFTTSSAWALLGTALERCVAVLGGHRYFSLMTRRRRRLLLAAPWLCSGVIGTAMGWDHARRAKWTDGQLCLLPNLMLPSWRVGMALHMLLIHTIVTLMQVVVWKVAYRHWTSIRRQRSAVEGRQQREQSMPIYWSILKMTVLNVVMVMPGSIFQALITFKVLSISASQIAMVRKISGLMLFIASASSGWMFAFLNRELREEYHGVARRCHGTCLSISCLPFLASLRNFLGCIRGTQKPDRKVTVTSRADRIRSSPHLVMPQCLRAENDIPLSSTDIQGTDMDRLCSTEVLPIPVPVSPPKERRSNVTSAKSCEDLNKSLDFQLKKSPSRNSLPTLV